MTRDEINQVRSELCLSPEKDDEDADVIVLGVERERSSDSTESTSNLTAALTLVRILISKIFLELAFISDLPSVHRIPIVIRILRN
jgi:hypothetical protein